MKMHIISIISCVVLLFCSCATIDTRTNENNSSKPDSTIGQKEKWELMTGTWYGEYPLKDGDRKQWIVIRNNNKLLAQSRRDLLAQHIANSVIPISLDDDVLNFAGRYSQFSVISEIPDTRWKAALSLPVMRKRKHGQQPL